MDVCALELCSESRDYQWDPVQARELPRIVLFPGRDSTSLRGKEIRSRVFAALDQERPAAVAVPGWSSAAALSALGWCLRRKRPAIILSESTALDERRSPWKEGVKRRVVGLASAGLAGGHPHQEYLQALGVPPDRVFLGYDVVDNAYFARAAGEARRQGNPLRASLGLPARYFLASNRFIEKKNLPALLTGYDAYRRTVGEAAWSLVLLGDGPLRPQLEHQRRALGLENHVLLLGFKQYGELPAYFALADGFVHASTSEQWGLVVNEAMACGLPVLVSNRCGCARDLVVEGSNGWTFNPHDPTAITSALTKLATLPRPARDALGQASRERIAAWTPETFAEGLSNAVEAALAVALPRATPLDRLLLHFLIRR